ALEFCVGDLREVPDAKFHLVVLGRLAPSATGLQPEDGRSHRLRTVAGRLAEEALGDFGGGLDLAGFELLPIVLAERLGIDGDDSGDGKLGNPVARHGLRLAPAGGVRTMCFPTHVRFQSRWASGRESPSAYLPMPPSKG